MLNNIVIWRPFEDMTESIESLHLNDLRMCARLQCSMVIKEFIYALCDPDFPTPLINNNLNVQYYWNNGKPFLCDLVEYYRLAQWHNVHEGGDDYDYFTDPSNGTSDEWWEVIEDCEFRENWSNWDSKNSIVHLVALMERNFFWYKRFGMKYKNLKFKDNSIYTKDGKPKSCTENQLLNSTYVINRDEHEKILTT